MVTKTSHEVELNIVFKKKIKTDLRSCVGEAKNIDYKMAANDLKKKILRGEIQFDSFDSVEASACFLTPGGELVAKLVGKQSKLLTLQLLIRRVYWTLNKTLRRA